MQEWGATGHRLQLWYRSHDTHTLSVEEKAVPAYSFHLLPSTALHSLLLPSVSCISLHDYASCNSSLHDLYFLHLNIFRYLLHLDSSWYHMNTLVVMVYFLPLNRMLHGTLIITHTHSLYQTPHESPWKQRKLKKYFKYQITNQSFTQ